MRTAVIAVLLALFLALPAAAQTVINGSREIRGHLIVDGKIDVGTVQTFADADATPDVSSGVYWDTYTAALTITDFDGTPADGDLLVVNSQGAITYDCTGAGLDCGTTDIVTAAGDTTFWLYDGTDWNLIAFTRQSADMGESGVVTYGLCDGLTDDEPAIAAALTAGNKVVLSPGTCVIGATLELGTGDVLEGRYPLLHPSHSILKADTGFSGPLIETPATSESDLEIHNLELLGQGLASQGILLDADTDVIVGNITIDNTLGQGLYFKGAGLRAEVSDVTITKGVQDSGLSTYEGAFQNEWSYSTFHNITADCNKTSTITESQYQTAILWTGTASRNGADDLRGSQCETGLVVAPNGGIADENVFDRVWATDIRGYGFLFDAISGGGFGHNNISHGTALDTGLDGPDFTWSCFKTADTATVVHLDSPRCDWNEPTDQLKCAMEAYLGRIYITGKMGSFSSAASRALPYCDTDNSLYGVYVSGVNHESRSMMRGSTLLLGREENRENQISLTFKWGHTCEDGPSAGQQCDADNICDLGCTDVGVPAACCTGVDTGTCNCYANDAFIKLKGPGVDNVDGQFEMDKEFEPLGGIGPQGATPTCGGSRSGNWYIKDRVPGTVGQCFYLCLNDHTGSLSPVLVRCGDGP